MDIHIHLRDGKRVDAEVNGYTVVTDQPPSNGGQGLAPDPFTLFLASIGTCAGYYVGAYCHARGIPTEGIALHQHVDKDAAGGVKHIELTIALPADFPAAQRNGVLRAAAACKVKKILAAPPPIEVTLSPEGDLSASPVVH
jgi:ribosomal protein S12 methylthiotransferase accessory factor